MLLYLSLTGVHRGALLSFCDSNRNVSIFHMSAHELAMQAALKMLPQLYLLNSLPYLSVTELKQCCYRPGCSNRQPGRPTCAELGNK